jgi:hypothetical protein
MIKFFFWEIKVISTKTEVKFVFTFNKQVLEIEVIS